MTRLDYQYKFQEFRDNYPFFIYEDFYLKEDDKQIEARFHFNISDKFSFYPTISIPKNSLKNLPNIKKEVLNQLFFHIGMVELISYWKLTCSPKVIVKPYKLNEDQIKWWKKLYYNGLGEFFYLNSIETDIKSFMHIETKGKPVKISDSHLNNNSVLVPVGGGKDSVVTLEILNKSDFNIIPFVMNPRAASLRTIQIAGFSDEDSIFVNRTLDPLMLEMNKKGFLNGHTPFSALLAFTASVVAVTSGIRNIALSNENSANESTLPGTNINHQYSKSMEFENDFRYYSRSFLHAGLNYFSFLRPLNELQIAKLFSQYPQHFYSFRSCNVGSKTDSWCGKCPKCLFTFLILSPFISNKELNKIFNNNLLEDVTLETIFEELTGLSPVKPFECVGTPVEVISAVNEASKKFPEIQKMKLLKPHFSLIKNPHKNQFEKLLNNYEKDHNLNKEFLQILINIYNELEN